jgi:hypothetical protein
MRKIKQVPAIFVEVRKGIEFFSLKKLSMVGGSDHALLRFTGP